MTERDLEAPDEDALEQAAAVEADTDDADDPEAAGGDPDHGSIEVDPADRAEQDREVRAGEDEYR